MHRGSLIKVERKLGSAVWQFRWSDKGRPELPLLVVFPASTWILDQRRPGRGRVAIVVGAQAAGFVDDMVPGTGVDGSARGKWLKPS